MREVSRTYHENAAARAREVDEAVEAKVAAEQEAASMKRLNGELQEELEQILHETDQRSTSNQEKVTLSKQLRQAQARVDEVLAESRCSHEALAAELATSQGLYQNALQRQQQLGSQVKALTADLALANQDKARHEESLGNLRDVLEEFRAEGETEVKVMERRLKDELALQATSFDATKAALRVTYETQLSEQAKCMQQEKTKARRAEALLEGENARIKKDLLQNRAVLEDALKRLAGERDDTLDRQLVSNLIVRYVTSKHKRQILELMARMFNFSVEEKEKVGLSKTGPTLPGMISALLVPSGQDKHTVSADDNEAMAGSTLSDLWMDFLIAETTEDGGSKPR
ncbi:unnamed protein product [Pylaiella littoralis]